MKIRIVSYLAPIASWTVIYVPGDIQPGGNIGSLQNVIVKHPCVTNAPRIQCWILWYGPIHPNSSRFVEISVFDLAQMPTHVWRILDIFPQDYSELHIINAIILYTVYL